ncbi:MAG: Crp/Fnr family transcriptional regulator [Bacteroidia bacterium]|nr:Crp/Fnr family transcriptional regulator [Bacteroidia bacterium]
MKVYPPEMIAQKEVAGTVSCLRCRNKCLVREISDDEQLRKMDASRRTEFFSKGQAVFTQGDPSSQIYFILSGKAKVIKVSNEGRHTILRFSAPGDIFGHRGIYGESYPVSGIVLEDSMVCGFKREDFMRLLMNNFQLSHTLLLFMANELKDSEEREMNLAQMRVPEKMAQALLQLRKKFGVDPTGHLGAMLSRTEWAEYAATTKEQVSKVLSDFQKDGLIELSGKKIRIMNPEELVARSSV